jgi:hypothetical protein
VVKDKIRKYSAEYLQYGFFWCGDECNPKPVCLLCGSVSSNQSMLPNKFERHLQANHSHAASKPRAYFERLLVSQKKSQKIKKCLCVSDGALVASFQVSEFIAQQRKAHTTGEELISPA